MEQTITTTILKDGNIILRDEYPGMLFSYILQFIPDRVEAGELLVDVFTRLMPRVERGIEPISNLYCWLQVETRKIILAYLRTKGDGQPKELIPERVDRVYYLALLSGASPEHRWVFQELFIHGRERECVASQSGKDASYVSNLLRECLLLIRKNLE